MSDSQLTSFFPGSAKHFLIKTIDKNKVDSRIIDKEGSDYSSGGGDPCPNPANPECPNEWREGWQDHPENYNFDGCGCLCTKCE